MEAWAEISGGIPLAPSAAAYPLSELFGQDATRGDFAALLGAIVFWVLSLFLLSQASSFQKWKTAGSEGAPDSQAGVDAALVISFLVFAVWFLYLFVSLQIPIPAELLIAMPFHVPKKFVPAPLIASVFPATVATVKFLMFSATTSGSLTPGSASPSLWSGLIGGLFSLLHVSSSIATLIQFRVYLFGG